MRKGRLADVDEAGAKKDEGDGSYDPIRANRQVAVEDKESRVSDSGATRMS